MKNLMPNRTGLAEKIQADLYTSPALVPATPWLATNAAPAKPSLTASLGKNSVKLAWSKTDATEVRTWILQRRVNGAWLTDFLPATRTSCELSSQPDVIAVTAIDRVSRASAPAVVELRK
jgi:hypothetical protein